MSSNCNTQNYTPWNYTPSGNCISTCTHTGIKTEKNLTLQQPYLGDRVNNALLNRIVTVKDLEYSRKILYGAISNDTAIPTSWSWRELSKTSPEYIGKIEDVREQGGCGSCWAFAVCQSLGDRYSLKYNIPSIYLSPMWLMNQTWQLMGGATPETLCCYGGNPYIAATWLESNIAKLEACWPYSIIEDHKNLTGKWTSPNNLRPEYRNCCYNCDNSTESACSKYIFSAKKSTTPNSFTTQSIIVLNSDGITLNKEATIQTIQLDIITNGPIIAGFQTFNDFGDYWFGNSKTGGIYIRNPNSVADGGHAVTLTGWGVDSRTGKRYWEFRNSWGVYNGDRGYGKIAFSTDAPDNETLYLDIPYFDNSTSIIECQGGTISILPGSYSPPLQNTTPITSSSKNTTPVPAPTTSSSKNTTLVPTPESIPISIAEFTISFNSSSSITALDIENSIANILDISPKNVRATIVTNLKRRNSFKNDFSIAADIVINIVQSDSSIIDVIKNIITIESLKNSIAEVTKHTISNLILSSPIVGTSSQYPNTTGIPSHNTSYFALIVGISISISVLFLIFLFFIL